METRKRAGLRAAFLTGLVLCPAASQASAQALFPAAKFAAGPEPRDAVAIDLDGDTVPDLATAGFASVSVLLGNGDGTLGEPVSYPIDGAPVALAVSDLDGDTVLDVVATSFSGDELNVLLGNGDGTLQARSPSRQEPTGTVSPTSWPSRNSRAPMPRPL